jgi:hypothetical protein
MAAAVQAQEHHHDGALAGAVGDWTLSAHGFVNAVKDHQGGLRGADESFANSMLMLDALRPAGGGTLEVRGMFSLDPLMGRSGYPLVFQTGETANGLLHLIDRQHPHDAFMEVSATYRQPLGAGGSGFVSAGLPGAAALGPQSFMHRASGERIPEAPISHHWLDSTHVAFGVVTAGLTRGPWTLEASRFNAREPDEARWNVETGSLDSSSVRLTFAPSRGLSMQVSYGFLHDIEELQANLSIHRVTASVSYDTAAWGRPWATTLAWGQNGKVDRHSHHTLPAWLLESTLEPVAGHAAFMRAERVNHDDFSFEATFTKVSVGWIVDVAKTGPVRWSVGALASALRPPAQLQFFYGERPRAYMVFLQARL